MLKSNPDVYDEEKKQAEEEYLIQKQKDDEAAETERKKEEEQRDKIRQQKKMMLMRIKGTLSKEINNLEFHIKKQEQIKLNFGKFRKKVLDCIYILSEMGLDSSLINDNTFPTEPFARGFKAKLFFSLVRKNEYKKVKEILKHDPFIIYEFDHIKQTALHHAAKRNFQDMTKLLCKSKAYIDKPDILGRTPL